KSKNNVPSNIMKSIISLFFTCSVTLSALSQANVNVYPTHWWVGMKNHELQLMLRKPGIGNYTNVSLSYPGVIIKKTHNTENRSYLFIDLTITPEAKAGTMKIEVDKQKGREIINYELNERRKGNGISYAQGVGSKDFIYLLM